MGMLITRDFNPVSFNQRNRRGQLERGGGVFFSAGNECLSAASFISKAKNTPPPRSIPHNPPSGAKSRPRMPRVSTRHKERKQKPKRQRRHSNTEGRPKGSARIQPLFGEPRPDHLGETVKGHHRGRQPGPLMRMQRPSDTLSQQHRTQERTAYQ